MKDIYTHTIYGKSCYVAFGKYEPFVYLHLSVKDCFTKEPGDLFFEFGETPGEAVKKLKDSMKEPSSEEVQ